jgi:Tfp pilus assembly protein PilN
MKRNKQISAQAQCWHPDFRDVGNLPDIKIIRTRFLLNALPVLVLLLLGYFLVVGEIATSERELQAAELSNRIATLTPKVKKAVGQQTEFNATDKKIKEIAGFVQQPMVGSDLLRIISTTLPRLVTIDVVSANQESVTLRGTVVGTAEKSISVAQDYAGQLAKLPAFVEQMESVKLNNQTRQPEKNCFVFEIEMKLKKSKPEPQAPKPAAKAKTPAADE